MKLEIMDRDWYKRRAPTKKLIVVKVELEGFEAELNHFCNMHVSYDDGSTKQLIGRVVRNKIKGFWAVDGMEVAVKVIEE